MRHSAIALGLLVTLAVSAPIQDATVEKRADDVYWPAKIRTVEKRGDRATIYRDPKMILNTVEKRDDDMVYADSANALNTVEKRGDRATIYRDPKMILNTVEKREN
ncbi:hypothetical protein BO78DRAFT_420248 [Aspergillus sclerotiicarbonarius CBS 121057]|uniref:Organic solvent tolerance-like N-terminal domain-containing protein n=1 Tax=Aspergillus sclerotiicarbonarius (strain CBS 121057 / IBT 28362) TaxID=1448318 RepID=A0A319E9D3_ASPSB|nr:hypothetical protein BO78DRAFT_420248 [Aspergillus sclerotiicarbonarius CBS 121057]